MVGERGITLSGGQKQRTALARAVVIDPRILILDDALSAVDTYTEEEILSRLRRVMRERTSIIVSHRISTVRDADRIFVLDDGRIVEQGSHDELIRHNGLYAELHGSSCSKRNLRRRSARRQAFGTPRRRENTKDMNGFVTSSRGDPFYSSLSATSGSTRVAAAPAPRTP